MPLTADLTIRETAALSGVPKATIEKAIESRILRTVPAPPRFRGGARRYLPLRAVAYFRSLKAADLAGLPTRHKRVIWKGLVLSEPVRLAAVEFAPGTVLDLERLAAQCLRHAEHYKDARDRHIASDPDILGGTPAVAGTRLTVYAVLGRLQDGDSIDDLVADYPEIPREAFMAAELYAKTHPLRGRPSGRPWRQAT
jgi:uncharacterized protein (DUF433 family)